MKNGKLCSSKNKRKKLSVHTSVKSARNLFKPAWISETIVEESTTNMKSGEPKKIKGPSSVNIVAKAILLLKLNEFMSIGARDKAYKLVLRR